MGREVRRVPENWEHPRWTKDNCHRRDLIGEFRPCFDETYEHAAEEWLKNLAEFEPTEYCKYYWEYDHTPDEETHRPAFESDPTWYQLYETVSEDRPVTPPFATEEELIDWLATHGDYWERGPVPTRKQASALVKSGYGPSMMVIDGRALNTYEAALESEGKG